MSVVGKQHEQSKLLNCERLLLLYFITDMVNIYAPGLHPLFSVQIKCSVHWELIVRA